MCPFRFKTCVWLPLLLLGYFNSSCQFGGAKKPKKLNIGELAEGTAAQNDPTPTYKVIGVKDGDTFVVIKDGKQQVVRFAHIDCPEKKQPFGNKARQFVSAKCFGKYVRLVHHNQYDRNKRLIAEVVLN